MMAPAMPRPTLPEVSAYAEKLGYEGFDAEAFIDYWESRGWIIRPGIPMRKWQPAVRTWQRNQRRWAAEKAGAPSTRFDAATAAAIADYTAQARVIVREQRGYNISRLWHKVRDAIGPEALAEVQRRAREGGAV